MSKTTKTTEKPVKPVKVTPVVEEVAKVEAPVQAPAPAAWTSKTNEDGSITEGIGA